MGTKLQLAAKLGVTDKTIRSNEKKGLSLVYKASNDIDIDESVRAYVKFQAARITEFCRLNSSIDGGNDGNDESSGLDFWRTEKEKEQAIKLKLENGQNRGDLVPSAAFVELINGTLTNVKNNLLSISSNAQKRSDTFDPNQLKIIDDLILEGLHDLREKHSDELENSIEEIIKRYAKYYHSTEEDTDFTVVE